LAGGGELPGVGEVAEMVEQVGDFMFGVRGVAPLDGAEQLGLRLSRSWAAGGAMSPAPSARLTAWEKSVIA
jgi:hypothetical protein